MIKVFITRPAALMRAVHSFASPGTIIREVAIPLIITSAI